MFSTTDPIDVGRGLHPSNVAGSRKHREIPWITRRTVCSQGSAFWSASSALFLPSIGGGKLIAGKPVGAGLYICMIVCLSVGFLMLLRSQAQSKAGE